MSEAKWYIINVLSGHEKNVVQLIKDNAEKKGALSYFEDFIVPIESGSRVKKGKSIKVDKKIFPGYIMVKVLLNDLSWNIIKNTSYVAKLLGAGNKPFPVPEDEINRVLKHIEDGKVFKKFNENFEVGEDVKITSGAFENFSAIVEEVDSERHRLKLLVMIFGRETPVELAFDQVEKLEIGG